ncbi:Na/Pi symporter [Fontimonas sp. SYSU GA230001]|uniref:Na/Pi cotransporter family protein n=1 Tax=Fontimonas sp. SYSU GA230001 TaxID=3142450 RepID=UPI0032B4C728
MAVNEIVAGLAGGLGLFLLGMLMMTEGLKLAAGPSLERILANATRTRWHALGSGILVTALVQSSSAVTVAAIGFVNAGLLGLGGALWVLFGANVGTTMTGWIVALLGLKFKVEALALPLIGIGVALRVTGTGTRRGAVGEAIAGFGLLFFGIALLQDSFSGLAAQVSLPQGSGATAVVAQVGIGALLTVLMQSSSASMTIALTAAQGGLLTPQGAAAVVIGANIGTTVTAVLAAAAATSNARRAAAAHVIFNVVTGVVALLLLPWLIDALAQLRAALGLPSDPAAKLALFHTIFNVLGVLLMWPFAGRLTVWLQHRFRVREEDEGAPRYLDDTTLGVPTLAVDALEREVARIGALVRRMLRAVLDGAGTTALAPDQAVAVRLDAAAQAFVERMSRAAMSEATSEHLAGVLRALRYHETAGEQVAAAAALSTGTLLSAGAQHAQDGFVDAGIRLLDQIEALQLPSCLHDLAAALEQMERAYEGLKVRLLADGAAGIVKLTVMEAALRRYSALRRGLQQAAKAVSGAHGPMPAATPRSV